MAAYIKLFVLATCIIAILAQRKPGDCPPSLDIGECSMLCYADKNCPGTNKCCRTLCGGSLCVKPVTMRNSNNLRVKPGNCPTHPSGPWVCSSRCAFDGDCRGRKKCCRNRCGATACTNPE